MTAVTFNFDIPRTEALSANDRLHHQAEARLKKVLRQRGDHKARECGVRLKSPVIQRVHVGWPDGRKRDRLNLAPTVKALIDGIAPHVLGGDSDLEIDEERWRSAITRKGHIEISISFEEIP